MAQDTSLMELQRNAFDTPKRFAIVRYSDVDASFKVQSWPPDCVDSKIAVAWIRSEARRFKPFVSVRVGEIQTNTDPSQWKHIPGEMNVADDVSRGIPVRNLVERWQHGPTFLRLPENEWPQDSSTNDQPKVEEECRKVHNVCVQTKVEHPINFQKFSSWRKLVRVPAYMLRLIWTLRAQCHNKTHPEENDMKPKEGPLFPEELQEG
ncbi:uncharacterized protein [Montipora capricornis]|uniref:uncharacterized protein n=1 Tax=Montipora capricornis TaxID=246305 RepID=UPI0035F1F98B